MGLASWRPDVFLGLAMNADPNDPYMAPVYDDWTAQLLRVSGYERGRNFELDQGMTASPAQLIRDVNELLDPENTSSAYYGLVEPYRESILLAQWPNQPVGGAVNLFNTGAWKGNKEDARDGSFEVFADNTRPSWVTPLPVGGATDPLVNTGVAFAGVKKCFWSTVASTTPQGISWPVACIPGRQYTVSAYVNQAAASTQRISVSDQVVGNDPFNVSTANGWGTDKTGRTWTVISGLASQFAKGNLAATIALNASGAEKIITVDTGSTDHTTDIKMIAPDPATVGASGMEQGLVVRLVDGNNYYAVKVIWRADGTVGLTTTKRVAGVGSIVVAEVATGWGYQAGDEFILETFCTTYGTTALVNSAVWPSTKPRPLSWHNQASDGSLLTGTSVGARALTNSTVTLPYTLTFFDFSVTGYIHGSTTAATGAYNRVSATWTATRPVHNVQMATTGTALAGLVRLDAIQHEPGAAASTYTTSGPAIYPVYTANMERYPRTWDSAGYEGRVEPPSVDAMAAMQALTLYPEYPQAVLSTGPDYYYRLNDGTETGEFPDTSGNGRPPLTRYISKYGAGTDIAPDSQISIPGDPGTSGVLFTQSGAAGSGQAAGTALGSTSIALPEVINSSGIWGFTFSCWATAADIAGAGAQQCLVTIGRGPTVGTLLAVMFFEVDCTSNILSLNMSGPSTSASQSTSALPQIFDGLPHHYVATINVTGANADLAVWVDGVEFSGTYAMSWPASTAKSSLVTVGMDTAGLTGFEWNGVINNVAMWDRVLTDAEISHLNSVGRFAYNGELSGARADRHLTDGSWFGPRRITVNATETAMQPPSWAGTKDGLTDWLETTAAEGGTAWIAPDGYAVMESRNDRWLRLTPSITFGENTAGGEIPYLGEGLLFDRDPLYVFADVTVQRINGAQARGGRLVDIKAAARKYFPRQAGGSWDFWTDALAQSMANWVFYSHRAPMTRVSALTFDPVSNPALWPVVLGMEVGQRVRVVRRAKAANSGAGLTISLDFFIEKIAMEIDFEKSIWRYRVQLSPIGAGASAFGQPTMQPWILGDATYGVLNQTTVLGW